MASVSFSFFLQDYQNETILWILIAMATNPTATANPNKAKP
jgi:hypothetical protein